MLRFKTSPYIASDHADPATLSIADQFAQIMVHICLEYDLQRDVLAEAQDVFEALKASGKKRVEPDREAHLAGDRVSSGSSALAIELVRSDL